MLAELGVQTAQEKTSAISPAASGLTHLSQSFDGAALGNPTVMPEISLAERVDSAIATSPFLSGRRLRFETVGGRVVLQGVVGTYFQKQMAQEAIRRIEGVEAIDNCLEVSWY